MFFFISCCTLAIWSNTSFNITNNMDYWNANTTYSRNGSCNVIGQQSHEWSWWKLSLASGCSRVVYRWQICRIGHGLIRGADSRGIALPPGGLLGTWYTCLHLAVGPAILGLLVKSPFLVEALITDIINSK